MTDARDQPFRFMDLPGELRNKIFHILLCSFSDSATPRVHDPKYPDRIVTTHTIDTAILRTNSQVHREAYDVMVKTNRFVQVKFAGEVDFLDRLTRVDLPIVTANQAFVSQFQGFAMTISCVSASANGPSPLNPRPTGKGAVMICAQDLDMVCLAIADSQAICADYNLVLNVRIEVAPVLRARATRYKPSLDTFFSMAIQESLLLPFRQRGRGLKRFTVCGQALPEDLAKATCADVAQNEWTESENAIQCVLQSKERGQQAWKAGDIYGAYNKWGEALIDLTRVHRGSSWSGLVQRDGDAFVNRIAEIYFLICLNAAQAALQLWKSSSSFPSYTQADIDIFDNPSGRANLGMNPGYWREGFVWRPSDVQLAKLRYRQGHFARLIGGPFLGEALLHVEEAHQLLPGDSVILRERQTILQQMRVHS
jgi:hypothetical protein